MNDDALKKRLQSGLDELGQSLVPAQLQALADYVHLLEKWNRTYNLTAVRDPAEMVTRHLLDSLAVLPFLSGATIIDVGTGPGLPGIPLAIARPELSWTLLDANAKKTRFVTQVIGELHLNKVQIINARAEEYRPDMKFDTLVSRAFASIADMLACSGHLCAPGGRILAMKGTFPEKELADVPAGMAIDVRRLVVPGLDAERHLVILDVPRQSGH